MIFTTSSALRGVCLDLPILAVLVLNPAQREQQSSENRHEFKVIRTPVDEATVLEALERAEQVVRDAEEVRAIPKRTEYIKDFVAVLQRCNQQDKYRKSGYELNDGKLSAADSAPLKLKLRTVARIIRLLGSLESADACSTLMDFLTFPDDVPVSGLHRVASNPTEWALFQIGDASLPFLRQRMASQQELVSDERPVSARYPNKRYPNHHELVTNAAVRSATVILGPRAEDELEVWIADAKSVAERNALINQRSLFRRVASNLKGKTLEAYRTETLLRGREMLEVRLKPPLLVYPDEIEADLHKKRPQTPIVDPPRP
jgi:hypothetical protein